MHTTIQPMARQAKVNFILLHIHTTVTTVTVRNKAKIYDAGTSQPTNFESTMKP